METVEPSIRANARLVHFCTDLMRFRLGGTDSFLSGSRPPNAYTKRVEFFSLSGQDFAGQGSTTPV